MTTGSAGSGASFMIVYTIVSPLMGWMGDRYNRKVLLAGGVGLWSLATVGTAFSADYYHMFFWRALLGIGEASYGVIAPTLLSDLFPVKERGRAMGVYYLALPVGTALGYILGGTIADWLGWRAVFFVVGLPGLAGGVRGAVHQRPRPRSRGRRRSRSEGGSARLEGISRALPDADLPLQHRRHGRRHLRDRGLRGLGLALLSARSRPHGPQAGSTIGGLLVVASLVGIALGTFVADLFFKVTKRAYLLVAAAAVLCATPLGAIGILDPDYKSSLFYLFGASLLMSMVLGPCNTVTANVIPANRRAAAYAAFIFLIHLFGDISSLILLGWVSDFFGKPKVINSPIGKLVESIGAKPVDDSNLTIAMLSVVPVLILGFVFFLIGSRYLPADQERIRAAGEANAGDFGSIH